MAYFPCYKVVMLTLALILVLVFPSCSSSSSADQLCGENFYNKSCPNLIYIVRHGVQSAIKKEARMGASLLRLHFHDCFVNGCDGSVLLDDTSSFKGEKTARPNLNSARGFDVVDNIKSAIEQACPGKVSCADILAITARESVVILKGPSWEVKLGRRDSIRASLQAANNGIPAPTSNLTALIKRWSDLGLSTKDLVALSGSHTIGQARCTTFRARIYNETGNQLNGQFAKLRQGRCPAANGTGDDNLAPLDFATPTEFDNNYYKNLYDKKGLLHSDQQLFTGDERTNPIVKKYIHNQKAFEDDFVAAIIKMGDISPLTGRKGEIRTNCRRVNTN